MPETKYIVIGLNDREVWSVLTHRLFPSWDAAMLYIADISPTRMPKIVETWQDFYIKECDL